MGIARVVSFEGSARLGWTRCSATCATRSGPEGLPAAEIIVLHDAKSETALVVLFFETEDDYRRGDEVLNAMPADDTPGRRASVTRYDVAVRMTA